MSHQDFDQQSREENVTPSPDPSQTAQPPSQGATYQPFSLLQLVNVLLSHRWKVAGPPLVLMLVAIALALLGTETTYTSIVAFAPDRELVGQRTGVAAVAPRFGLDMGLQQTGQSLPFYAHLLETQELLRRTVSTKYAVTVDSKHKEQKTLVEIFQVTGSDSASRLATAASRLKNQTEVSVDGSTGIIELTVTMRSAELSRQVAERMVRLLEEFNQKMRQSRAAAEERFIRGQLSKAKQELFRAEDSLQSFLERNRSFGNSPTLRFEHERLERRVRQKEQLYTSLAESYEEARISKVRNTPEMSIVEPARAPQKPDPHRVPLKAMFGVVAGGIIGIFWAFAAEFIGDAHRTDSKAYERFLYLRRDTLRDLREAGRKLRFPWPEQTE